MIYADDNLLVCPQCDGRRMLHLDESLVLRRCPRCMRYWATNANPGPSIITRLCPTCIEATMPVLSEAALDVIADHEILLAKIARDKRRRLEARRAAARAKREELLRCRKPKPAMTIPPKAIPSSERPPST